MRDPENLEIWLRVNDQLRQKGHTKDMIFRYCICRCLNLRISELISMISTVMRLEPGDFILTGTPSGVGPIKVGDTITAGLGHDLMTMRYKVVSKPLLLHN